MSDNEDHKDVESLLAEQLALTASVQRLLRNFIKDAASRKTKSYFQLRLESLSSYHAEFRENHRKLIRLPVPEKIKTQYTEAEIEDNFEEVYLEAASTIREAFDAAFPLSFPTLPAVAATNQVIGPAANVAELVSKEVPLPEIKLSTFSGAYVDWPTFKEVFLSRIHNSERLNDFQRFHYLKGALTDEAAQDIQHITLLGENYQMAWKMLNDLYENNRVLFTHYMELFDKQHAVAAHDPMSLKRFVQTCRSCVSSIAKLGVNINGQNEILVYYMLKKLPTCIHHEWDRKVCKQKTIPTFEDLCKVLDEQYQMMITSSHSVEQPSSKQNIAQGNRHKGDLSTSFHKKGISALHITKKTFMCPVCTKEEHPVRDCLVFRDMNITDRRAAVEKFKLCFNCLGHNHTSFKCSSPRTCSSCRGRHHTLIHLDRSLELSKPISMHCNAIKMQSCIKEVSMKENIDKMQYDVLLPTAVVKVNSVDGESLHFRAFLDQGSQASFITEYTAQLLRLPRNRAYVNITGLSKTTVAETRSSVMISVASRFDSNFKLNVLAYVLPKVCNVMPERKIDTSSWKHLDELQLADQAYFEPQQIDILLGNDAYDEIIMNDVRRSEKGHPIAQQTVFGYIVSGKVSEQIAPTITISSLHNSIEIERLMRKFWELEDFGESGSLSTQDQWCEQFFTLTYQRLDTGKYLVRLPFLSEIDPSCVLGNSRQMALKRFAQLEGRLARDPKLKSTYKEIIDEYISLGQMSLVKTSEQQQTRLSSDQESYTACCYLPHHPVIKESSSTTKVRIVFDASSKTSNGNSLNDILATGPALQKDLLAVLTNWRFFKFVFTADIEKMYRRVDMHEEDAQFQRILWRDSADDEIKEYFCSVVMFGTASAPFTAIRTLHQLAQDEAKNFPLAVEVVKGHMYVDDVLSGGDSIQEALARQQQITGMLRSGTFELRKWASNSTELLNAVPAEHRETRDLLQFNSSETVKTLGLFWSPIHDCFRYKFSIEFSADAPTKRSILSTIARLFDPLGWLNPVIVSAKVIMQELWTLKLGWDIPVPDRVKLSWKKYVEEFPAIMQINIPRWLNTSNTDSSVEIHLFSDASIHAYSAAAYIRVRDRDGNYHSSLLIAKSKVAPIKPKLTIPRAELCGAVLATKIFKFVIENVNLCVDPSNVFFWTDSMITLGWIRGDPHRWKLFVFNRINKILESSSSKQWQHVASCDNPVDCSSRGMRPANLVQHKLWWHGPDWFSLPKSEWPSTKASTDSIYSSVEVEMKQIRVNIANVQRKFIIEIIEKFSSLTQLKRVISYCKRFIFNCRQLKSDRRSCTLLAEELDASLVNMVRIVQQDAFACDWNHLLSHRSLTERSPLLPLNPFIDRKENVLRLGGRLRDALLPFGEKHPLILPAKHHFTKLIVEHSHLSTMHGGTAITLNHTRKRFWIINGRNIVRFAIHRCITCYRHRPNLSEQMMGDLPALRIRPSRPFSSSGVDYAGPINISPSKGRGRTSMKGYIAVFICLVTKAIHLEPVGDLSADAFIGALRRFIGRRGLCNALYSDCGTNFIGANKKLEANRQAYETFINSNIKPFLNDQRIQWHFIPPSSPHFGGLWEAGVKSMKHHLKRTIGERILTFEELSTVLAQIESCLNSRPLCPLTNDPADLLVLTPGHFLIGDSLLAPPEPEIDKLSSLDRWKSGQFLVQQFWRRWSSEYLSRLQKRPKWLQQHSNIKVNDVVLMKDERLPCNRWPLARVIETHPGADNLVRVVTVKTPTGILKRPITKMCLLPIQDNWHEKKAHQAQ